MSARNRMKNRIYTSSQRSSQKADISRSKGTIVCVVMTVVVCIVLVAAVGVSFSAARGLAASEELLTNKVFAEVEADPLVFDYEIVNQFHHDPEAFTQGLQFERRCSENDATDCKDVFWESTGLYGESTVREVQVETGTVLNSTPLDSQYFGEGLAKIEDRIYQLTWQVPTVFVYNESLSLVATRETELSDGWGLTTDGESLIATDSGSSLYWIDPETFKTQRNVTVRDGDTDIFYLNELEWINRKVWANIWYRECLAVAEPVSGRVSAWVVLEGLSDIASAAMPSPGRIDVLNGIAYDAKKNRLFVTGKLWPLVFEIELKRRRHVDSEMLAAVRKTCHPGPLRG